MGIAVTIAVLAAGIVLGGHVLLAAVVTPVAHRVLGRAALDAYLPALFPLYHRVMAGIGTVAVLGTAFGSDRSWALLALALATVGHLAVVRALLPRIAEVRAAARAGDPAAGRRFSLLHRASVGVAVTQLLLVAGAIVILVR